MAAKYDESSIKILEGLDQVCILDLLIKEDYIILYGK